MGRMRDKRRVTFTATATKRGHKMEYNKALKLWLLSKHGPICELCYIHPTTFDDYSVAYMIREYLS
jgi:hypothetical protein